MTMPTAGPATRPPFDPELAAVLGVLAETLPPSITPEMIAPMREALITPAIETLLEQRHEIIHREETIPGYEGAELTVSIFARRTHDAAGPGIYHTHGGGMIVGDRFTGMEQMLDWVDRFDAVCVSVEYRLAPEHPDPYPVEDCYAGLVWTAEHAGELGSIPSACSLPGRAPAAGWPPGPRCWPATGKAPRCSARC